MFVIIYTHRRPDWGDNDYRFPIMAGRTVTGARANRLEKARLPFPIPLQMQPGLLRCFYSAAIVDGSISLRLLEADRRKLVGWITGVVDRARSSAQAHIMLHRGFLNESNRLVSARTKTRTLREHMASVHS